MSIQTRRQRERAERRELIVTAARELAESEGWDAVTTRRLAERVEYSQPVLYSHFSGKKDIVRAVAIEGFGELGPELRRARLAASSPEAALREVACAYLNFAVTRPAQYEAMFAMPIDVAFGGTSETPATLRAAFGELVTALEPLAGDRDLDLYAEIAWVALHGLATLTGGHRLRPAHDGARLDLLIDHLIGDPGRRAARSGSGPRGPSR